MLALSACGEREGASEREHRAAGCLGAEPPIVSEGMPVAIDRFGYQVAATPGAIACVEDNLGGMRCNAVGPARIHIHRDGAEPTGYELRDGEVAVFALGQAGASCTVTDQR